MEEDEKTIKWDVPCKYAKRLSLSSQDTAENSIASLCWESDIFVPMPYLIPS